ncbi:MAG: T9SS type A sorting domain-containing protein [Paludibacter sp.]
MKRIYFLFIFISLGLIASAQNLLTNPSFENWSTTTPTGWTLSTTAGGTVSQVPTSAPNQSGYALQIAGPTATFTLQQNILPPNGASTFDTGKTYKMSLSYLVTSGDGADARVWSSFLTNTSGTTATYYAIPTTHADTLMYYNPFHGPGGNLNPTTGDDTNGYLLDNRTSGIWHTYSYSFKFPIGITQFNFAVRSYSKSTIIWDDFNFSEQLTSGAIQPSTSQITGLNYVSGSGPSAEQVFSVSGSGLTAGITINAPVNYEISTISGSSFSSTLTLSASNGTVAATNIYVRLKAGLSANTYTATINLSSTGVSSQTVALTGTVSSLVIPVINLSQNSLSGFTYIEGSGPSAQQSFTVSGSNLSTGIVITAPTNYEISISSGSSFNSTLTLSPTNGTIASTTIYSRMKAGLSANTFIGNITLSTTGLSSQNILLNGIVTVYVKPVEIKVLFDATKAEMAGNADWVIDSDIYNIGFSGGIAVPGSGSESNPQQFPTPDQSNVTAKTTEDYWTGALSSWAIDCVKKGLKVETLPYNGRITFGDNSNSQDLSNYNVFIVCEPNSLFTASEKTAIINYVNNGGSLFMVSDHTISDRNGDGKDSPDIWNDLLTNNTVKANPFGISFDLANIVQTTTNVASLPNDSILNGEMGSVNQLKWSNGTTMTLSKTANPTVVGEVFALNASNTGNTNVMFATARYGKGKVAAIGDSSPCDDGTGDTGDNLYVGYTDMSENHRRIIMNATLWLVATKSTVTNTESLKNADTEFDILQNPVSDGNLKLSYSTKVPNSVMKIAISDLSARVLYSETFNQNETGKIIKSIDVTRFNKGLYLCQFIRNNVITVKKIIF